MSTMLANAPTNIDPLLNHNAAKNVVSILACTNDLASSVTPATCYSNLQAYCTARHAAGWNKCIVMTLPSNQFIDNSRTTLNTMLRANHSWADGLVDFVGTPYDPNGSWTNSTWYLSDGVHWTEQGIQTYVVPTVSAVINASQ